MPPGANQYGDSGFDPAVQPRAFSFTAGEPLGDFLLAFDHAPGVRHDDKFEIVGSSAYRLPAKTRRLDTGRTPPGDYDRIPLAWRDWP